VPPDKRPQTCNRDHNDMSLCSNIANQNHAQQKENRETESMRHGESKHKKKDSKQDVRNLDKVSDTRRTRT
jgi:hypothetical protein